MKTEFVDFIYKNKHLLFVSYLEMNPNQATMERGAKKKTIEKSNTTNLVND